MTNTSTSHNFDRRLCVTAFHLKSLLQVAALTNQITALEADKAEKAAALTKLHAEHEAVKAAAAQSGMEAADREAQLAAQLSALQERLDVLTKEAETAQNYQQELEGAPCSSFSPSCTS